MSLATTDSNLPAVLGRKELDTLRRTIAHDLNDSEFELFAAICRRTGLDPIARQIYAVKRWDGRQKREVMQVQTSIDGFRVIAQRSGNYAGSATTYWCGPDGKWVDVWLSDKPPAAAKAGVYRRDFTEPTYAVAKFESYCARNKDGSLQNLWRTMPEVMIAKCAEALAIRKAFPNDVAGVYTREEMAQANNVQVTVQRPKAPSLPAEVSGGGEPAPPPAPSLGVRIGGEGSPHESDGVGQGVAASAPTPSGAPTEPGGEPPAPPTTSTLLDVTAVEQTVSLEQDAAPAGPDIAATPSSRKRGGSGGDHGAGQPPPQEEGPHDGHVEAQDPLPAPKDSLKAINPRAYQSLNRKCRAIHAEHGDPDKGTAAAQWEALAWAESGGRTTHLGELSPDEASRFRTRMVDVSEGRATWAESDDPKFLGWTLTYREADR